MSRSGVSRSLACRAIVILGILSPVASAQSPDAAKKFLGKYCLECHSKADPSGEREFETLDLASDHRDVQLRLQEIIDQLNLGVMPPKDSDQPKPADRVAAVEQMTTLLATGMVDVGPVITHRFALTEFEEAFEVMSSGRSGKVILLPKRE